IDVAKEVIKDERRKRHGRIVCELTDILDKCIYKDWQDAETLGAVPLDSPLYEVIHPDNRLSDVVLSPANTVAVEKVIQEFNNRRALEKGGRFPKKRLLFYGPPGCGKTLTAKALASELELPLIYLRFDAFVSYCLGKTSSEIWEILDDTRYGKYVILLDEFDDFATCRSNLNERMGIKRVVNALLQRIDRYLGHSLIIAVTNYDQCLDYGVWNRFDCMMRFDMPSDNERKQLFQMRMMRLSGESDWLDEFLPQLKEFSHSDVEKVALWIIKKCVAESRSEYVKEDVEAAVLRQREQVSLRKTHYC
ncbi:MAG: ATP-binding protein, partial [Clostridiales bacterium]|nr:ATP-binding protein [Clostridiales bacterium]